MEIPKTRKELFEILWQHNSGDRSYQCSYLKDYFITEMGLQNLSREELRNVQNTVSRFCSKRFKVGRMSEKKLLICSRKCNLSWTKRCAASPCTCTWRRIKSASSRMCFIFARTKMTPDYFRPVKQKNKKEENGSCTKKFLDGGVSLR